MTSLLPTLSGILLLAALTALPASALTLAELEKSYEDKRSEIRLEKDKSMDGLKKSYLGALTRIETKYQRAGRLDEVLLVKDEMKDISIEKWPLLALPKKISLEVAAPRKIYLKKYIEIDQTAAREAAKTADKMLALLEKQSVSLTKSGDLQQALLARQIKDEIESDDKLTDARKLLANVMSDGRSRPALRIRRFGDNKEVIVRYDMRGKISMDSPVSNLGETDKSIGNTSAKKLGEFVGAKGYEVDAFVMFDKTFNDEDLAGIAFTEIKTIPKFKAEDSLGLALSLKKKPVNPYAKIPVTLPLVTDSVSTRLTIRYFVPETNIALIGFQLTSRGQPFGGEIFATQSKWVDKIVSSGPFSNDGKLLLYLQRTKNWKQPIPVEDKVVLGSLKIEQIKFSAFVIQRLGKNGVIAEEFKDPASQPKFISNGELLPQ